METVLSQLEHLKKEIKWIKESTDLIKKCTQAEEENIRYLKFLNEYIDMLPDSELPRFILLMKEFGIFYEVESSGDTNGR